MFKLNSIVYMKYRLKILIETINHFIRTPDQSQLMNKTKLTRSSAYNTELSVDIRRILHNTILQYTITIQAISYT